MPIHLDAIGGSSLTRVQSGDAGDAKLGNAIMQNLKKNVKTSRVTEQDTAANLTVKNSGSTPSALVEVGVMSDLIDRYGNELHKVERRSEC